MMQRTAHICGMAKQPCKSSTHICAVNLQPCNAPRIDARSVCSPAEASAYMRARLAALQQQIAGMRGGNAEMKIKPKKQ